MTRLSASRSRNNKSRAPLPPILRDDKRPNPSVASESERLKEFGRLMVLAVERLLRKNRNPQTIKEAN